MKIPVECFNGHKAVRVVMVGQEESKPSDVVACHACGITAKFGDRECRGCKCPLWRWEKKRSRLYCTPECKRQATNRRARERRAEERELMKQQAAEQPSR